jgi:hypothetical protein
VSAPGWSGDPRREASKRIDRAVPACVMRDAPIRGIRLPLTSVGMISTRVSGASHR